MTTTVEQIDFDERVLFRVTDTEDGSSIVENQNRIDVPLAFTQICDRLHDRIHVVLAERFK